MENTIGFLVKQYLETGNEHYFEELVIRFQPLMKSYVRKLYYLEYDTRPIPYSFHRFLLLG